MDKFKVGDKVKLVSMKNEDSFYKKYLGKIFTIKEIKKGYKVYAYFEEETDDGIAPYLENLELVKPKYTYKDLKKSPIGTKITFENGYLIKFDKERVYGVINGIYYNGKIDYIILFLKGKVTDERFGKIIKIEEPEYKTVYECKPEILDEAEKRYLRNIVNPFKDKVISICKIKRLSHENKEYIVINIKNEDTITLPYFDKDTMYKGMKANKEYTLKELGL